jgi:hypothetical protein
MVRAPGIRVIVLLTGCFLLFFGCGRNKKQESQVAVRGWNILSDSEPNARRVIDVATTDYDINHIEFSHQLVNQLKDVRPAGRAELVNRLTAYAHEKGIKEVFVWDQALYDVGYYPEAFRRTVEGKERLDLDDPDLWRWIRADYRSMLMLVPEIDGIVLNFLDAPGKIAEQFSARLPDGPSKVAAVIDSLARIFIDRHNLSLCIRAAVSNQHDFSLLVSAVRKMRHPAIKVMITETEQAFLLTHPLSTVSDSIRKYPIIVEFDAAHEYNGQGILASMLPEVHLKRWKEYMSEPNIEGYVARTDRFYQSTIIDGPCEINLYALKRASDDPWMNIDQVYTEFVSRKYGEKAGPYVEPAFRKSYDIITSMMYTLGLPVASHLTMSFSKESSYISLNPGKWQRSMEYTVDHDVNRTYHYWMDVTNHLAPAEFKKLTSASAAEIPQVFEHGWLDDRELMNVDYLRSIVAEKDYAVRVAQSALEDVLSAKPHITNADQYSRLIETMRRTEMASRLYRASAKAYFAYRIYARGGEFRTPEVVYMLQDGLDEIATVSREMTLYPYKGPRAEFDFVGLATSALALRQSIVDEIGTGPRLLNMGGQ